MLRASTLGDYLFAKDPLTSFISLTYIETTLLHSFGPILFKQVPYTMAKFYFFEIALEALIKATGKQKEQLTSGEATGLNLAGGVISGCCAAFVSQPADTLLSKINKSKALPGETTTGRLVKIAQQLGVRGLFAGMGARFVMIGTLTAGQFAIYGDLKRALGATGGYGEHGDGDLRVPCRY